MLLDKGIRTVKSEAYVPWRNGLLERKNRQLKEHDRSMCVQAGLGMEFWTHGISTATYLLNRTPTKRLNGRTPFEAMHGRMPDVSHLRVFGSVCYPLNVIRDKKTPITAPAHIFVGYDSCSQGYLCFDPVTRCVKSQCDVCFDEHWRPLQVVQGLPIKALDNPVLGASSHAIPAPSLVEHSAFPTCTEHRVDDSTQRITRGSAECMAPVIVPDAVQQQGESYKARPLAGQQQGESYKQ